jgi:hypothetical protein
MNGFMMNTPVAWHHNRVPFQPKGLAHDLLLNKTDEKTQFLIHYSHVAHSYCGPCKTKTRSMRWVSVAPYSTRAIMARLKWFVREKCLCTSASELDNNSGPAIQPPLGQQRTASCLHSTAGRAAHHMAWIGMLAAQ